MSESDYVPAGILTVNDIGPDKKLPARLTKKFEPKKWKPLYDLFVYWHVMGWSNIRIAQEHDMTPQQVCNVLTSNQGKMRIKVIESNLRESRMAGVSGRMENIASKLLTRMEAIVDDADLATKSPFAVFDRGLAVLKSIGQLRGEVDPRSNGGSPVVGHLQINDNRSYTTFDNKTLEGLRDAIAFSREASAMHEHLLQLPSATDIKPTEQANSDKDKDKVIIGSIQPPISKVG